MSVYYTTKKEKEDAEKPFQPRKANHWRNRCTVWEQQAIEDCEDVVYGLILDGASGNDIARFFGVSKQEFKDAFGDVLDMALAERILNIKASQLKNLRHNRQPQAQALLGRLFAEQSADEASTELDDSSDVEINVKIIRRDEDEE